MDWILGFDRAAPGLTLAFVAGAVNTLSPCCLAMTPAFLAHLAGVEVQSASRRVRLTHALVYVVGFSLVFVAIGAGLSFAGYALTDIRSQLFKVGGTIVIAFGLVQMGVIPVPALQRSFELRLGQSATPGYARSFLVDVTTDLYWGGRLDRDYYRGPVLVCQRGIVTPDGTDLMGNAIDDFLTLNDRAGTLVRY